VGVVLASEVLSVLEDGEGTDIHHL
jgi:hypothetical protein